jgi:imidazoleglycerol-phosphate dehydratase
VPFTAQKIGEMDTELFEEFFRAFAMQAGIALHIVLRHGSNAHHIAEGCFKAAARALRMAVELDPRAPDTVPSTKGVLEA